MEQIWIDFCNRSIAAGWFILAIAVLRAVFYKAPKRLWPVLWGLAALRLVCPFSVKSVFSLIPNAQTIPENIDLMRMPAIDSGISSLNGAVNPFLAENFAPEPIASANPLQIILFVAARLWILGMVVLAAYSLMSYVRLRLRLRDAVLCPEGMEAVEKYGANGWLGRKTCVYQSQKVTTPFVLGAFRPRIYLPFGEGDMRYALVHEWEHIRHRDPVMKLLGWILVILYWFCPLMWLAWVLFERDLELACDERVIGKMTHEERIAYSQALLSDSKKGGGRLSCPLSFGSNAIKARIKSVLDYKKPALWVSAGAVLVAAAATACFLTDPQPHIDLPESGDVINAAMERIGESGSGGLVLLSEKQELDRLLNAMKDSRRTNRISQNDEPAWSTVDEKNYFLLTINQEDGERLIYYLYRKGGACFLERAYDGIYRTDSACLEEVSGLYEEKEPEGFSYTLFRIGADGEVNAGTSLLAGGRAEPLRKIVEVYTASSTYMPGIDVSSLEEYYRIDVNFEDGSGVKFYVYEKDGTAAIQTGPGKESFPGAKLSRKLYEEMTKMLT